MKEAKAPTNMEKNKIYKIRDVNITRNGKVKNYVIVESSRRDFFPCFDHYNIAQNELVKEYKKLQAVKPPQLLNAFHSLIHFLFLQPQLIYLSP